MSRSPDVSRERVLALYRDGVAAFRAGDRALSLACNEEALRRARELGDRELEALALVGLSRVALRDGHFSRVRELASDARSLVRDHSGDAQIMPLHMLAAGTRLEGDYQAALELYTESLDSSRRLGDRRMVAVELHNLGHVHLHLGRISDAEDAFAERRRTIPEPADPYNAAMSLLDDAALAEARGEHANATSLLDQAIAALNNAGIELDPDDAFEVRRLKERLGPAR